MSSAIKLWLVLNVTLFAAACVNPPHVVKVNDSSLPLLPPATMGSTYQVTQSLHGEYGDKSFSLRCVVSVNPEKLSVICLTAMGLRAFSLSYDGQHITEQRAPQVPDSLQATRLLNDLQLAFWPLKVVQQSWQLSGVQVSEPYPGVRRAMRDNKIITEVHTSIDPWKGRVWIHQNEFGYNLYIESAAMD